MRTPKDYRFYFLEHGTLDTKYQTIRALSLTAAVRNAKAFALDMGWRYMGIAYPDSIVSLDVATV